MDELFTGDTWHRLHVATQHRGAALLQERSFQLGQLQSRASAESFHLLLACLRLLQTAVCALRAAVLGSIESSRAAAARGAAVPGVGGRWRVAALRLGSCQVSTLADGCVLSLMCNHDVGAAIRDVPCDNGGGVRPARLVTLLLERINWCCLMNGRACSVLKHSTL